MGRTVSVVLVGYEMDGQPISADDGARQKEYFDVLARAGLYYGRQDWQGHAARISYIQYGGRHHAAALASCE